MNVARGIIANLPPQALWQIRRLGFVCLCQMNARPMSPRMDMNTLWSEIKPARITMTGGAGKVYALHKEKRWFMWPMCIVALQVVIMAVVRMTFYTS